ncbi:glutamate receptor ionotropic, kainate 2 isoform X2 [Camponotus floridanus]|uniref:glutamate receptor ionotropic, kainate 2 isoform X2 n=1 Tax=Camponotus floridanus TaxID=104421 RepID=UPI000DC66E15|nr:glutamate receptor ionotropic, kainate 2 isoform X2 [Camponotus floridanus]
MKLSSSSSFIKMDLRQRPFLIVSTLLILATCSHGTVKPIKIGGIFHKGDEDHMSTFLKAISETKYESPAPAFEFISVIKYIDDNTDSFRTAAAACELLEEGVAAIFGPTSSYTRGIVASIATRFEIPHIEYVWRETEVLRTEAEEDKNPMTINVFPESENVSKAIADTVDSMKWQGFVAIYENNDGLSRIQKALTLKRAKDNSVAIRELGNGPDYRPMLKEIRNLSISNILLDVQPEKIINVLRQAKEIKLLADYSNFVITYLDASKLPIVEIRNGTNANITGFSLRENDVEDVNWLDSAILYDAVFLLQKAIETLNSRNIDNEFIRNLIDPVSLSCKKNDKYQAGPNITSIIRELSKMGKITGAMNIDEYGRRWDFKIQILDFRSEIIKTGFWDKNGLQFNSETEKEMESYLYKSIKEKEFIISTIVGAPYVMEAIDASEDTILIGQKHYEGYCIDLIKHIAKDLGFSYKFEIVPGSQGTYDPKTKSWNGLIRHLLDHKSDLAICDLTITFARESAVDFSMPFMNLGISILFSKPEEKDPDLFSFLSPLSTDVWMYMATAYLAVSIMLFVQARMAPGEWDNPHPCNAEPEELENNFDLKNSLWLTIGSLMQQGSDILPKAPSIRTLTTMWWFFTLIMISSYTANLAAFLTAAQMETPINNVDDLARQTKIKYGSVGGGATSSFFRDSNYSIYKRMFATMMETKPSVFTKDNKEGVERVVKSKGLYAFLMESTTIEYQMQRNCEIDKIGGLIDNKGYGIALPRNSPYRTPINSAILRLGEKGTLQQLKTRWWREKGGGLCDTDDTETANTGELGMANVGGVFLVLMLGCGASLILAIVEFLWNVRDVAVREKITPGEALKAELRFAVNIWETKKPVKIAKSSSSATSLEGGFTRAASTARSIVGSFLRLDILDKIDKDHDTNNRSNDRKIN